MRIPPIALEIILHYACCVDSDYRGGDFSAPAVAEWINYLDRHGIIEATSATTHRKYNTEFEITARGRAYVDILITVPFPVHRWVDPRV